MSGAFEYFVLLFNRDAVEFTFGALVAACFVGLAWGWWRSRRRSAGYGPPFREREQAARRKILASLNISPEQQSVKMPSWFVAGQGVVDEENRLSGKYQRCYHFNMAATMALLSVAAVVVIVGGLFIPEEMKEESYLLYWYKFAKKGVAVFDVAAIAVATGTFILAKLALRQWVKHRAVAELMRMRLHLLLPFQIARANEADVKADLATFGNALRSHKGRFSGLLQAERESMAKSLDRIPRRISNTKAYDSWLVAYILERPISQYAYFEASTHRLERSERSREWAMFGLFGLTFLIALAKVLLVFNAPITHGVLKFALEFTHRPLTWLTALFVFTLISSAYLTSSAIARNDQSQITVYGERSAAVERWLSYYLEVFLAAPSDSKEANEKVLAGLREFEQLMLRDTEDFVARTERLSAMAPG